MIGSHTLWPQQQVTPLMGLLYFNGILEVRENFKSWGPKKEVGHGRHVHKRVFCLLDYFVCFPTTMKLAVRSATHFHQDVLPHLRQLYQALIN